MPVINLFTISPSRKIIKTLIPGLLQGGFQDTCLRLGKVVS